MLDTTQADILVLPGLLSPESAVLVDPLTNMIMSNRVSLPPDNHSQAKKLKDTRHADCRTALAGLEVRFSWSRTSYLVPSSGSAISTIQYLQWRRAIGRIRAASSTVQNSDK